VTAPTHAQEAPDRTCSCGEPVVANGVCALCNAAHGLLRRRAVGPAPDNPLPPIVYDVLASPGRPLDAATRGFMEAGFGQDFSQVRVHTDTEAGESARAVRAAAYTVGDHVAFAGGRYDGASVDGRRLLAHELAHVVQQRGTSATLPLSIAPDDSPAERDADRLAEHVVGGQRALARPAVASAAGLSRKREDDPHAAPMRMRVSSEGGTVVVTFDGAPLLTVQSDATKEPPGTAHGQGKDGAEAVFIALAPNAYKGFGLGPDYQSLHADGSVTVNQSDGKYSENGFEQLAGPTFSVLAPPRGTPPPPDAAPQPVAPPAPAAAPVTTKPAPAPPPEPAELPGDDEPVVQHDASDGATKDDELEEPDETAADGQRGEPDETAADGERGEPDETAADGERDEPDDTATDAKPHQPDETGQDGEPAVAPSPRTRAEVLIDEHTSFLMLDEDALGAEALRLALSGDVATVEATLDELDRTDRDDVSNALATAATDEELAAIAKTDEGRKLLLRLVDELSAGSMGADEAEQIQRVMTARLQDRDPQELIDAPDNAMVIPFSASGFTKLGSASIDATHLSNGKIRVRTFMKPEHWKDARHLPSNMFAAGIESVELDPDQIVGVHLYDEGGKVVYVPAMYLLQLSNQEDTKLGTMAAEAIFTGLTLGGGEGVVAGGEAVAAGGETVVTGVEAAAEGAVALTRAQRLAKGGLTALKWGDRITGVLGAASTVLNEHRGFILSELGEERGKWWLDKLAVADSVLMVYGIGRGAIALGQVGFALRSGLTKLRARRAAAAAAGKDVAEFDTVITNAESKLRDIQQAEAAAEEAGHATADVAQAEGKALASKPVKGGHHIDVTAAGIELCSPKPCPLLHVEYAAELKGNALLSAQMDELNALRKTDPAAAVQRAADLRETLAYTRKHAQLFNGLPAHVRPGQRARLATLLSDAEDAGLRVGDQQLDDISKRLSKAGSPSLVEDELAALEQRLDGAIDATPATGKATPVSGAPGAGGGAPPAHEPLAPAAADPMAPEGPAPKAASPSSDDPLVVVKIQGEQKGLYWREGSPRFKKNAGTPTSPPNEQYIVLPESQANADPFNFKAAPPRRKRGTPPKGPTAPAAIKPRTGEGGVPLESTGAGRRAEHPIMARTSHTPSASGAAPGVDDLDSGITNPAAAHAFPRTVGAEVAQSRGYNELLSSGERGILRPGNISTGGVDAITAEIKDGKAKIYLNDFTSPEAWKGVKSTHPDWRAELNDAVARLDLNDKAAEDAIHQAIKDGEVYVRPVRVHTTGQGAAPMIARGKLMKVK
jgi:hypothetical protein